VGTDAHSDYVEDLKAPANNGFAITPHDSNELSIYTRAIYVGGAGDLEVILVDDSSPIVFSSVPAGTMLPIRAKIVKADNTTATNILGLH
jgi:hypothetical protein